MTTTEVASFARTIHSIVVDHPTPDPWSPGSVADDLMPRLQDGLAGAGWYAFGEDDESSGFTGPAAIELGRGLVAVREIDTLLGGSPCLSLLTRYAQAGDIAVRPTPDGLQQVRIISLERVPYGDSFGAGRVVVEDIGLVDAAEAVRREGAWTAATIGYLAGLAAGAVQLALEHTTVRQAFGASLSAMPSVQQRLADAALSADGLGLLAEQAPDFDSLAYAGSAACAAVAQCHQVVGAIGYTLEFPLQRYSRRARAMQLWADAWIEARQ